MKYRAEIDGLRALAVLPVIFFHAGFDWFSGGFVGVDVFFVISGFLITSIIISDLDDGRFSLVNFYERRARRILPALFFVIFVSLPFAWLWLFPGDLKAFGRSLVAVSTFSSNFLFWLESGYFDTAAELKPLLHTWSLAVEEQYYILFPAVLMLIWRLGLKWVLVLLSLVLIISLGVAHWATNIVPTFRSRIISGAFFLLPTRGWELLIGVLAAFYLKHNSHPKSNTSNQVLSSIGFGMIVYAIIFFDEFTPFPSLYALVPTVGTALVIFCAVPDTLVHRILSFSPIVGVGLISYSAYLWHQPLLAFARHRALGNVSDLLLLVLCLTSLLLAYVSWRWVERPFREKGKLTRKHIVTLSLLGTASIGTTGLYLSEQGISIGSIGNEWSDAVRSHRCLLQGDSETIHSDECFEGPDGFLIWGDSHAAALSIGLREYAHSNNRQFSQLTQSGCPPLLGLEVLVHRKTCNIVNETVLKEIILKGYTKVILHAAWIHEHYPLSESELERKLDLTVQQLKKNIPHVEIVIIGNSPRWSASPYQVLRFEKELLRQDGFTYFKPLEVRDLDRIFAKISERHGIQYINLINRVCVRSDNLDYCPLVYKNSDLLYLDWGHLNRLGSNYFVSKIADELFL
jgi:peptidoglycan/LPS O-acetylase OafA/YrhL